VFFFQAEDGIRDFHVTGVQTCALPILDTEFSHTMSELFETSVAKRFGSVERRGLRGVGTDKTTRMPVDQLARSVVNLNSPQAIEIGRASCRERGESDGVDV